MTTTGGGTFDVSILMLSSRTSFATIRSTWSQTETWMTLGHRVRVELARHAGLFIDLADDRGLQRLAVLDTTPGMTSNQQEAVC